MVSSQEASGRMSGSGTADRRQDLKCFLKSMLLKKMNNWLVCICKGNTYVQSRGSPSGLETRRTMER